MNQFKVGDKVNKKQGYKFPGTFDKTQKESTYNQFGNYQFGCESCQFCKSDNTDQLMGLDLLSYKTFYGEQKFKAFKCNDCTAQWHKKC